MVVAVATVASGIGGLMAILFGVTTRGDVLDTGSMRVLMMGMGITMLLASAAGVYVLVRLWRR